jgi:hypothetical protein
MLRMIAGDKPKVAAGAPFVTDTDDQLRTLNDPLFGNFRAIHGQFALFATPFQIALASPGNVLRRT